eukprot:GFUD01044535.1.p1 GENE.GFUD01044535.1~~GFUD01044535.1.p1  ORF type:complete len:320 (+),score=89.94 GFUD01044535.1:375-1334(+)
MVGDIPPPPHNWVNVGLILASVGTFLLTTAFNALAGSGAGVPGVFYSTVGNISDKYQLFITPAGFTFSIWSIIYLWLAVSLGILVVTIFRKTEFGRLYLTPEIASPAVTATLSVNFVLNLAWIFIWDRSYVNPDLIILASIFLFLIAITNILVMVFMAKNIGDNAHDFTRGSPLFWWGVTYRIILNGLGMYTTWTVIASLINLTTALVYAGQVDQREAVLAALSLLVIFHCTWFVLENTVLDKYARYILTPYLVVIWASNGIRAKKMDDPDVPQDVKDFVLAILIIAILTFVVRLSLVVFRVVKKPLIKISTVTDFDTQ